MMKKMTSMLLALVMCLSLSAPALALEENSEENLLQSVSELLDNNPTTQTITVTEQEVLEQMLKEGSITHEELNNQLGQLSIQSEQALVSAGYDKQQIEQIKSYTLGADAYTHLFGNGSVARVANEAATVAFRFGLAGSDNTQKALHIAYDIRWSKAPFFCLKDSFGIGWIACDSQSKEVITKIDSVSGQVAYYKAGESRETYSDSIDLDDSSNNFVIGTVGLSGNKSTFAKMMGGQIDISSQSGSYNIYTVQIFVAYGHTTIAVGLNASCSLTGKKETTTINFTPSIEVSQEIILSDHHTFKYNSQEVWPDTDF